MIIEKTGPELDAELEYWVYLAIEHAARLFA